MLEQKLNSEQKDEAQLPSSPNNGNTIVSGSLNVGDIIRDIEDTDCYYEGIVVCVKPVKYKVNNIFWCGENDDSLNGEVIELKWWILKVLKNGKFVQINCG